MAIEIKEYVGHQFTSINNSTNPFNLTESHVDAYVSEDSIMVDIEAIHSRITRNNTYYSPNCLKQSVPYWTNPYRIPVIMHHNETDGQIIGRVHSAEYTEVNTRGNTPALTFTVNVGDEDGKKGIKNGTLSTVSIGVIAHDLRCSVCKTNLAEQGLCEHEKGEVYDIDGEDKLCYWIIEKMEPKEVSYVIVPSDAYAHNIRVYDAVKKNKSEVKESMEYNPFADLIEATKVETTTKEGKQIDEEVGKGSEVNETKTETPETKEVETTEEPVKEETKTEETKTEETSETKEVKEEETKVEDEETKTEETEEKTNKELDEAKEKISALEKENEELKKTNAKLEKNLEKVKETKEAVELQLVEFKAEKKKQLVEQVIGLRTQLGLTEEDAVMLGESSEESLTSTIKNLTEFTKVQKQSLMGLQNIESPVAVSESKDNTVSERNNKIKNVKETLDNSNKSLEDEIINLMETLF